MSKFTSVPAYSFSKSNKKGNESAVPGHGAYDSNKATNLVWKNEDTTVVMKPLKSPLNSKISPIGPGEYNISVILSKPKGFFFPSAARRVHNESAQIPGTGQYKIETTENMIRSRKIGTQFKKSPRMKSLENRTLRFVAMSGSI